MKISLNHSFAVLCLHRHPSLLVLPAHVVPAHPSTLCLVFNFCIYLFMQSGHVCATGRVWRSEENLQKSFSPSIYVGSEDQTQVLNHVPSLVSKFLETVQKNHWLRNILIS